MVVPREAAPRHLQYPGSTAQHLVASAQRIRQELGYKERIPREEGIRRTIPWERANPPRQIFFAPFDYEAEDESFAKLKASA